MAGVNVERAHSEPAAILEISPLYATSAHQLQTREIGFVQIKAGETVLFDESWPKRS